ncbi:MAG: dipeptidase, partial [Phycisphaerae bacterium]|nr:dipeptidase [Phycisphaerae bacterium]
AAEIIRTERHPIVFAQSEPQAGKPTVLIYGHYDVQPPDPLDEWESEPFEPSIRNGAIFARGASDDKGQLMCHVAAVQAWMATKGDLPVNVKFVVEGEEEVSGDSLAKLLRSDKARLGADYVVISDSSQLGPDAPAITYGLRGLVYIEVILSGPAQDLHSGQYGGAVANPANVLSRLIGGLHDEQGHVMLEGFYEGVKPIDAQEREALAELGCEDDKIRKTIGVEALSGEEGYSNRERMWARPTLDVNGLVAGYIEPGAKTIIPAKASAKISMRLVDRQNPKAIAESFKKYFRERAGAGVSVEFIEHGLAKAVLVEKSGAGIRAAKRAVEKGFSSPVSFVRTGGSIPIVSLLAEQVSKEILLMGFSQPDDNAHGPNEKFRLEDYHKGQLAAAYLLGELGRVET